LVATMAPAGTQQWADLDSDDEEEAHDVTEPQFQTKPDENGNYITYDYVTRDGKMYKVQRRMRRTMVTSWINKAMIARKTMKKFGKAATNDAEHEKRMIVQSEEEISIEFSKKIAVQVHSKDEAEDKFYEESLAMAESMNQQKKAWTEINRLRQSERDEVGAERPSEAEKPSEIREMMQSRAEAAPKSAYVPPSLRGKGSDADGKGKGKGMDDQQDCSLRITNLSDDAREGDLQELFNQCGRVCRVYIAKDQQTGAPRGFAFVTYHNREDAKRAVARLNGYGYDNLILQVQFAKPRQ